MTGEAVHRALQGHLLADKCLYSHLITEVLIKLETVMEKEKSELAQTSKTGQLWLNYPGLFGMVRMLIKADCTGSWLMHLQAVPYCLNVVVAAGHLNYLRTAHYYLQKMSNLEEKHPDVYRKFLNRFRVILRSNQCWAGLWSGHRTNFDEVCKEHWWANSWQWDMSEDMRNLCTLSAAVASE